MPGGDRRRNPDRAERLALRPRQDRYPAVDGGGAGHRERSAADLRQSGRWSGRTGVRRRIVRAARRPHAGGPAAVVRGKPDHAALAQDQRRLALRRADRATDRRRRGRLCCLRAGLARLRQQDRLSGHPARGVRRYRLRAVRGDRRRCAGRRPGPWRHAAVPLYRAGVAR